MWRFLILRYSQVIEVLVLVLILLVVSACAAARPEPAQPSPKHGWKPVILCEEGEPNCAAGRVRT